LTILAETFFTIKNIAIAVIPLKL